MSEPFIAEIRIFAGNFAPRNWAFCNGALLPISQNTALFTLIGTTYGGDGRTTTGLPDLQGRAPMHPGNGPGLTSRSLGERSGAETVTLSEAQMGSHSHPVAVKDGEGTTATPDNNLFSGSGVANAYQSDAAETLVAMDEDMLGTSGSSQAHNNMQPYLTVNFIIALQGVYPSRS